MIDNSQERRGRARLILTAEQEVSGNPAARTRMFVAQPGDKMAGMFTVDEVTAEAIRRAFDDGGELAGVVELRRHFPLLADNAQARLYVRTIAGWQSIPDRPSAANKPGRRASRSRRKP